MRQVAVRGDLAEERLQLGLGERRLHARHDNGMKAAVPGEERVVDARRRHVIEGAWKLYPACLEYLPGLGKERSVQEVVARELLFVKCFHVIRLIGRAPKGIEHCCR